MALRVVEGIPAAPADGTSSGRRDTCNTCRQYFEWSKRCMQHLRRALRPLEWVSARPGEGTSTTRMPTCSSCGGCFEWPNGISCHLNLDQQRVGVRIVAFPACGNISISYP